MLSEVTTESAERKIVLGLHIGVVAVIVCPFLWRIFGIPDPAHRFFDDFFYYLLPAEHWVDGAGSTFFPGEPTNGYHPLWFLWVALLYRIAGESGIFFGLLDLSLMALLVGFYFLFERFLRRVVDDRLAAAVGAGVAGITLALLAESGLETALTVFAAALLLCYLSDKPLAERTVRDAAVVGLLGAFLVLSRLDAAVLLFGLAVAVVPRWDSNRLVALAAGAAPLYLYLAFNLWAYGHLTPTSMEAKTLDVYVPPNWYFLQHPSSAWGIALGIIVIMAVLLTAVILRRNHNLDTRKIALALPAAVLLQFAVHPLLSGWILFAWYAYFSLMALGLAAGLLVVHLRRRERLRVVGIPLGATTFAVVAISLVLVLTAGGPGVNIAAIARQLQAFSVDHPGVYAMGDAAGTPAWMTKQPIVQLEGLMMSHAFLDRIRQRQQLDQVFRDYHVSYYVAQAPIGADKNSCHDFLEPNPAQSSPRAPHMAMTICAAPVAVIQPIMRSRPDEWIYRIDPETGRPS
jgi:hypothetical protein